ncbi:MAG TPA: hypothetical protein VL294_12200 [Pseudolysinimonas sp.]|jgi:hypothetical protein|nr:hypothetical protein [Pseudolysinimonas sp.]
MYIINKGGSRTHDVEAAHFRTDEHWVTFFSYDQQPVFAIPTKYVATVEWVTEHK